MTRLETLASFLRRAGAAMKNAAWSAMFAMTFFSTPSIAQTSPPVSAENIAKAQTQCERGNTTMCDAVGVLLMTGRGIKKDMSSAGPLLKSACDKNNYDGCYHYGLWLSSQENPAGNWSAAVAMFKSACDKGTVAKACTKAGLGSDGPGEVTPEDLNYIMKGCDAGDGGGCVLAGMIFEEGKSTPKDPSKALTLLEKGCSLSEGVGCMELAIAYHNGDIVPKDENKARMYRDRGCKLGASAGC